MWQTIGHEWAIELFQRALTNQQIAQANLLTGPAQIGKRHLALEIARALNCLDREAPCQHCSSCQKAIRGNHPDILVVEPEKNRIRIDQVRQLQHALSLSPYEGRWRVGVLVDVHRSTIEAENALLKTLEEPPDRAVVILTATHPGQLLSTIVSRCRLFALRPVPSEKIARALIERWHQSPSQAETLARLSEGRIGWAIQAATDPGILRQRQQDIETLNALLHSGPADRLAIAEKLAKREDLHSTIRLWQSWWRDAVLLSTGRSKLICNQDCLETLQELVAQHGLPKTVAALKAAEQIALQLDHHVNTRLALETLFLDWPRIQRSSS